MKQRVFIALVAGALACPRAGLTQQPQSLLLRADVVIE
jgi:hypothetical protein